jgi:diguanylate cyclase (GGDEF)-like protein
LTGLPNRALFLDRLDHALARLQRDPGLVGVLFIDLDRFKIINDTAGHEAGDEVLRSVAALFEAVLRPGDTVARLGGDEFAVCCENLREAGEAVALADRLSAAVSLPFVVENREFFVSPSIGVVLGRGAKGESASTLLRDADAAMYVAKDRGRGRVEVFDQGMREDVVRRAEVAAELRHALQRNEFCLHFQPLVGLADGELRGFEALLRWEHPERGLVPPGDFIDVAEETNLIVPIGQWVLEEAARQLAAWRDELPEHPITISVNLSARQLSDPDLVRTVRSAIETCEIEASALCLEITESVLMEDAQTSVTTLRNLKALGVELSIDDFGTGYSSLAYLKRFPVDYLKIDRSFVNGIGRESEDTVIVKAVVDLGAALGLAVVAEGVETQAQLDELRRIGCDAAQGYWWSIPLPPAEAVRVAADWKGERAAPLQEAAASEESSVLSTEELLRVLTHEMATPLTVVRGQCERLLSVVGDMPEAAPLLQSVVRNAERIDRLVTSLSDAQQSEIGALSVRPGLFDLVALVRDVAPTVLPEDRELRIEAPDEVTVEADGARVEQILVNLLTNAEKFSPPDSAIVIGVDGDEREAWVVVADEGPGVPPERVADIFRKFGRLERSKKGVGLGLFLSRRLARAHGGELQYRRRHPAGSEFVLTLPRQASNR